MSNQTETPQAVEAAAVHTVYAQPKNFVCRQLRNILLATFAAVQILRNLTQTLTRHESKLRQASHHT